MRVTAASYNPDVLNVYRRVARAVEMNGGHFVLAATESPSRLAKSIGNTEVLIAWKTPVTEEVLEAATNLKLIMASGSGFDHIDIEAAKRRSIAVTNSGTYNSVDVAQHAVALVLACLRRIPNIMSSDLTEPWPLGIKLPEVRRFDQATVSVIGYGAIGAVVAQYLLGLGFEVVVCDPYVEADRLEGKGVIVESFDGALQRADVLTLHLRLDESSRSILDDGAIKKMPIGSGVVNTSRGGLIDGVALAAALSNGHLACAALDVLPKEPPLPDDPILSAPNLLITGHSAGVTREAEEAWGNALLKVLDAYVAGRELPNRVV